MNQASGQHLVIAIILCKQEVTQLCTNEFQEDASVDIDIEWSAKWRTEEAVYLHLQDELFISSS